MNGVVDDHTVRTSGARRHGEAGGPGRRGAAAALTALTAVALLLVGPAPVLAQGFGIYEHGTCAMARGGAATAQPCDDGSALFFNPAGLAGTEGITVTAGGTLIAADGGFTDDATLENWDLENDPIPVPHLYGTYGVNEELGIGLGVFVPYGLETQWPTGDFPGRFVGYDNGLNSVYVQPTVAYKPAPWISLGAGLDVVIGTVTLNQRLDLSQQEAAPGVTFGMLGIPFHTEFANVSLESDAATGVGGNFGVQIHATQQLTFGAKYMTQVTMDYEGDADFSQIATGLTVPTDLTLDGTTIPAGTSWDAVLAPEFQSGGSLVDQGVTTSITMPDQIVAGVAYRPMERLLVEADWQWVNWEDFGTLVIDFESAGQEPRVEDYGDTNGVRVGGEYDLSENVVLRGGYLYHGAAAPDKTVTPLLPENNRNEVTAGFGWQLTSSARIDVAYQYIAQDDRRGRVRDAPVGQETTAALNSGLYKFQAHLFGTTLTLHF